MFKLLMLLLALYLLFKVARACWRVLKWVNDATGIFDDTSGK